MWCRHDAWIEKNIQQMFLKFTAQQLKFSLIDNGQVNTLCRAHMRVSGKKVVGDKTDHRQIQGKE
jgi:hypothetical protein